MEKKILLFILLALVIKNPSFSQIFRGAVERQAGSAAMSLNYIEHDIYQILLQIDGVSIFLDQDNIADLRALLEKFQQWEIIALTEQISITRTLDLITFTEYHHDNVFYRQPLIFYAVFTGGPIATMQPDGNSNGNSETETPTGRYTLFFDTNLERITPFRLSSETAEKFLLALSPENLADAWQTYEHQKALEDLFY